jgi:hypothetical protein
MIQQRTWVTSIILVNACPTSFATFCSSLLSATQLLAYHYMGFCVVTNPKWSKTNPGSGFAWIRLKAGFGFGSGKIQKIRDLLSIISDACFFSSRAAPHSDYSTLEKNSAPSRPKVTYHWAAWNSSVRKSSLFFHPRNSLLLLPLPLLKALKVSADITIAIKRHTDTFFRNTNNFSCVRKVWNFADTGFLIRKWGLGSMSGPRENSEKSNKKITQPLKKVPILRWLSSTSQAGYRAFLKHLWSIFNKLSSIYHEFSCQ